MLCRKCKIIVPDESVYCIKCGAKQEIAKPQKKNKSRGNGTGTAFKRGKTWQAEVTLGKKPNPKTGKLVVDRRTKGGFATKTEALEYIPILKAEQTAEQKRPTTTLAKLWEGYSTSAMLKLSKSKQGHFTTAYQKLRPLIHMPIAKLTINDLQDLVDDKAPTFYPAKDIKTVLTHLYKRAQAQQDVLSNLAEFITLPELEEGEPKPFNADELKKLWEDYGKGNKMTGYVLLMIYSGMMPGELCKAEKNMIHWDKQQIIGCGLKTKKRKETPLVVADLIVPVLQDLCDFSPSEKLLTMRRDAFYDEFHVILERAGVGDRTPYACRHTTATALALGNIAPEVIKNIMRHAKFSTTQRYIHTDVDTSPMLDALNTIITDSSK